MTPQRTMPYAFAFRRHQPLDEAIQAVEQVASEDECGEPEEPLNKIICPGEKESEDYEHPELHRCIAPHILLKKPLTLPFGRPLHIHPRSFFASCPMFPEILLMAVTLHDVLPAGIIAGMQAAIPSPYLLPPDDLPCFHTN
jgi:hypothetical protein